MVWAELKNGELIVHIPVRTNEYTVLGGVDEMRLTNRQREVFGLLLSPLSLKEIAEKMNIALRTVKFHAIHVYRKAGLSNRTDLLARFRLR